MFNRSDVIEVLCRHNAVLIPLDGKEPFHSDWQKTRESHPDAIDPNSACNIGVVLGDASGGLVDVDIDRASALPLADFFLPTTNMVFGRKSKPRSHRVFRCAQAGRNKKWQDSAGVIVELRANGGQTMFPPSVHPSGEQVEFDKADDPKAISWSELEGEVAEFAIATVISTFYVSGCRHDLALALAGVFCRAGWPQARAQSFIEKLARAHDDNEIDDRLRCVKDVYLLDHPPGLSRLAELTDQSVATSLAKWLGCEQKASSSVTPGAMSLETELDCANLFVAEHRNAVIYDDLGDQFFRRQNGVHAPVSDVEIQGLVQSMAQSLAGTYRAKDLARFHSAAGVKNIVMLSRPMFIADAREFDCDPLLFGVRNGVIDLRTKTLTTNPSSIVTKRMRASYVPDADCPRFKKFLDEVTNSDAGLLRYLRRVLGYIVTGLNGEQVILIAIGSGANGKSTFFSVLQDVLGDYAGSTPTQTLMQTKYGNENTYDLAAHEGKRLVIAQEGEADSKLAEAKIKAITGGDPIACRPIYGKPKTYDPRFKLVLVTNELPHIIGVDEAIWRRIKLVPFRVTFSEERRDPNLKDKLLAERDGILTFLIECYAEYNAECRKHPGGSGLGEPEAVKAEIRDYRASSDTVGMFLQECCDLGVKKPTMTRQLFEAYEIWCRESGLEPLSQSSFGKCLGKKGFQPHKTAKGNGWRGVGLKDGDREAVMGLGRREELYSWLQ